jgi:hypothetical protein
MVGSRGGSGADAVATLAGDPAVGAGLDTGPAGVVVDDERRVTAGVAVAAGEGVLSVAGALVVRGAPAAADPDGCSKSSTMYTVPPLATTPMPMREYAGLVRLW